MRGSFVKDVRCKGRVRKDRGRGKNKRTRDVIRGLNWGSSMRMFPVY